MSEIIIYVKAKGRRYTFTEREFARFLEYFQERNDWHFSFLTQAFTRRNTRNRINLYWCQLPLTMR